MNELEALEFIAYFRVSSTEAALKSIASKAAAKVRAALRLRRRRPNDVLYLLAERALYLEALGFDRALAVQQLADEYRLRLEESQKRIRDVYNFVVYAIGMVIFGAIVAGVILGILSPIGAITATALIAVAAGVLPLLEMYTRPVRSWNYALAVVAMLPAGLAMIWPLASIITIPAAVLYGLLYYWPRYKEAVSEYARASRGSLPTPTTPAAKAAARVMKAVRETGAFDLQATAEYLLRLYDQFQTALRRDGLMRALVAASLVAVMAAAVAYLYPQLGQIVGQAQEAGAPLPLQLNMPAVRPMVGLIALVAALAAGRMTESYAAAPLYAPLALAVLAVP